jgi:hypothetical protein
MLHPNDFRSIWELAHLWANHDPDKTDAANLPEAVVDKLQKLLWGFLRNKLSLRTKSGRRVFQNNEIVLFM